ncbi:ribosomal L7Ae/L30e/S12e/Gadd45 family protein [Paucilactobacillus suebicus]|nr:ribosomal L7Ae/L30e/S12e/Gadd45 family protein [Paucilactobacillus suebicus]
MMTSNQPVLNLLGIARRAGSLISGEETVLKAIRSKKTFLVFISADAGNATSKKFKDKCQFYEIKYDMTFDKQQLNQATGQARTVYGVTQEGFARKFKELLQM